MAFTIFATQTPSSPPKDVIDDDVWLAKIVKPSQWGISWIGVLYFLSMIFRCTRSCGYNSHQTRTRTFIQKHGNGKVCQGPNQQTRSCFQKCCPGWFHCSNKKKCVEGMVIFDIRWKNSLLDQCILIKKSKDKQQSFVHFWRFGTSSSIMITSKRVEKKIKIS